MRRGGGDAARRTEGETGAVQGREDPGRRGCPARERDGTIRDVDVHQGGVFRGMKGIRGMEGIRNMEGEAHRRRDPHRTRMRTSWRSRRS